MLNGVKILSQIKIFSFDGKTSFNDKNFSKNITNNPLSSKNNFSRLRFKIFFLKKSFS